jgi:hypothetical protein
MGKTHEIIVFQNIERVPEDQPFSRDISNWSKRSAVEEFIPPYDKVWKERVCVKFYVYCLIIFRHLFMLILICLGRI